MNYHGNNCAKKIPPKSKTCPPCRADKPFRKDSTEMKTARLPCRAVNLIEDAFKDLADYEHLNHFKKQTIDETFRTPQLRIEETITALKHSTETLKLPFTTEGAVILALMREVKKHYEDLYKPTFTGETIQVNPNENPWVKWALTHELKPGNRRSVLFRNIASILKDKPDQEIEQIAQQITTNCTDNKHTAKSITTWVEWARRNNAQPCYQELEIWHKQRYPQAEEQQ